MKVGTDGVLLGAWCNHPTPSNILDIGSGTGLIALMCAQRFPKAHITAIEPEENAYYQAKENIDNSLFCNQINLINTSLQSFKNSAVYDLIVCNPPFYTADTQAKGKTRQLARHASNLPLDIILNFAVKYLSKNGSICLILPANMLQQIEENNDLSIQEITFIKGTENAVIKRIIIKLCRASQVVKIKSNTLVIEQKRHEYTSAYRALTKDFYLKF